MIEATSIETKGQSVTLITIIKGIVHLDHEKHMRSLCHTLKHDNKNLTVDNIHNIKIAFLKALGYEKCEEEEYHIFTYSKTTVFDL